MTSKTPPPDEHPSSTPSWGPNEPMTLEDVAARDRHILARNEERAKVRLAATNRERGHAEPQPGDKLFVTTARGIASRSRAGLRFDKVAKREVEVVDLEHDALRARQLAGASVVSVHGAEQILHDDSLLVHASGTADPNLHAANERAAKLEAENAALRADLAAARRNALPDPGDGTSSRLKAAAKVRAESAETKVEDFGAPSSGSHK